MVFCGLYGCVCGCHCLWRLDSVLGSAAVVEGHGVEGLLVFWLVWRHVFLVWLLCAIGVRVLVVGPPMWVAWCCCCLVVVVGGGIC